MLQSPPETPLPFLTKDTELLDLRETIDFLKRKNSEAQAVIQGALNASESTPKGRGAAEGGRGGDNGGAVPVGGREWMGTLHLHFCCKPPTALKT